MANQRVVLNRQEAELVAISLCIESRKLRNLAIEFEKAMDEMVPEWQGRCGKSFAEAAKKVQDGFDLNSLALAQMVTDATGSRSALADQDRMAARVIDSMTP